jgi:hypothetical protein
MVAKRQEDEEQSVGLRKLARESLAESGDNWDAALVRMRTRLTEDRKLWLALVAEAMGNAPTVADELGDDALLRLLARAEEESGGH